MKYNPTVIRSKRKTLSIEIRADGHLIIRAPEKMSYSEIERFINKKSDWIENTLNKYKPSEDDTFQRFTADEINNFKKKAEEMIPSKVKKYAGLLNVKYNKISIKSPKTRWGSCSSAGNLNFNCLIVLFPDRVIDSIIVHELCHRKEMNHSNRFYNEILSVFPDYFECDKWLKENGYKYLRKL